MLSRFRRILKTFHPEGIPWPAAPIYNAASRTKLFQAAYYLISEDILAFCPEGNGLDIGTGPAHLLTRLAAAAPRLTLTGLDISPAMVAVAEKNVWKSGFSSRIRVVEGSSNRLPFSDGSFDVVVSSGSFHHWKDPVTGLNEMHRVLCPGGYALVYDLVSDTPRWAYEELGRRFGRFSTMIFRLHTFDEPFYSSADLQTIAESTRFKWGKTRFVSVMCCLVMKKQETSGEVNV